MNAGTIARISDLNSLMSRIAAVRNAHASSSAQIGSIPAVSTSTGVSVGSKITTAPLSTIKNALASLANSKWYASNTSGTVTTFSNYGSSISIPAAGTLIYASTITTAQNCVYNAEVGPKPSYSNKYGSQYGSQYGGKYDGKYSNYSDYSDYSGKYDGKYSDYSDYGSKYNGKYDSKYDGKYSNYSNYSNYN